VAGAEGANPSEWWQLRSALDLGDDLELDLMLRHVGRLAAPAVPSYAALDLRLGWRLQPGLALSLVGRNLNGDRHGEFADVSTRSEFDRALLAKLEWQF
jgi:iron complex outermembrane receptor protein